MNPFGKLKVQYDQDDDDDVTEVKKGESSSLFTSVETKKKKKVRPEEKKKMEEEGRQQELEEGIKFYLFILGFSEVKKRQVKLGAREGEEQVDDKKDDKNRNKGAHVPRSQKPAREGKRIFDKHSGTGRG